MITKFPLLFKVLIATTMTIMAFFTLTPITIAPTEDPHNLSRISQDTLDANEPDLTDSYLVTPVSRGSRNTSDNREDIHLIIVYTEGTPLENYATALNSVECYAKLHEYPFHLFSDAKYKECSKHKDLFFRRHCCIARFMESEELKPNAWLLVLDGDIAVINPNTLIEKFVDSKYDITLFDRFFNYEVGANSYLVRNTEIGRNFVQKFSEYEFKLPKSFHGTDNGALHPYLVQLLAPENVKMAAVCAQIWNKSKNYAQLYEMEVCTRLIIGDRSIFAEHKLRILPKGKAWVRDIWLLKSRWTDDDFMVHGVKEKQLEAKRPEKGKNESDNAMYQWDPSRNQKRTFPLLRKLDIDNCESGEEEWLFDSRLKISIERKTKLLDFMEKKILKKRLQAVAKIARRL